VTQKVLLSEINNYLGKNCDLFICSSSFEERCFSISRNINKSIINSSWVVYNGDGETEIKTNAETLLQIYDNNASLIEVSMDDPLYTADRIREKIIVELNKNVIDNVFIDITTFTHEALLILIKLFYLYCPNAEITCLYTNALEYSVGEEKKYKWLSNGIRELRSVLGYAGNIIPSRKNHLIMIVGYEYERAMRIINTIEPNSLSLGFGRSCSATTEKDKEANEYYLQLVEEMATYYTDIFKFEIPCDSPNKIIEELNRQIACAEDKNIIIVPMNNKISTIGVALTAIKNENIQLCYAPAISYNYRNYSIPGNNCYIYKIEWK